MKIIAGNWKMYPKSLSEAKDIARRIAIAARKYPGVRTVICPPFPFISAIRSSGKTLLIGAQDVFWEEEGARTGEISPAMLRSVGASFVIVGHSERRALGESDRDVAKKAALAMKSGLSVILCVGEKERDTAGAYFAEVRDELFASLEGIPRSFAKKLIVAYEPIWAIGAKARRPATVEDFREMRIHIKKHLVEQFGKAAGFRVPILYGGSVDERNAAGFLREGEADGLLIGRVSLDAEKLAAVISLAGGRTRTT